MKALFTAVVLAVWAQCPAAVLYPPTGGGGGDVTSASATNIAAYQAMIATQSLNLTVTNAILALDERLFFSPQDQNLNLSNTYARVKAGGPLRIVNFGDDAFQPFSPTRSILNTFLKANGSISGAGGQYYTDNSAGVVQTTISTSPYIPIQAYGMPNGSSMTNRTAVLSDTITLNFCKSNAFGTLTIYTNNGSGGTETAVKVIDANNSGVLTAAVTNFAVAPGTWRARVQSSGSNFVVFCGQYHSGVATNYIWDIWEGANGEVQNAITNAFGSNALVTFSGQYDLVVVNDSASSNQTYTGWSQYYNAMTNRFPNTDLLFLQPPPATNAIGPSFQARQGVGAFANDYGASVLDLGGMFLPVNPVSTVPYYTADAVHLSTAGNALLATRLANIVANPYFKTYQITSQPSSSGGSSFWNTNATDGTITNINGGGVNVGTSFVAITNGSASFITLLRTPATPRIMVGGNQGASATINTNSLAVTNGSDFAVIESNGGITNSRGIRITSGSLQGPASGLNIGNNSGNNVIFDTSDMRPSATQDLGRSSIYWGSTYSQRFASPTNGIPANPVAGRSYSTNGSAAVTLGAFASVPNDSITETSISVSNSGTSSILVTFPAGTRGPDNSLPAAFYVSPASEAVFAVLHHAQRSTNVVRRYWTNALESVLGSTGGSSVSLTTATPADITSVTLLPGTWDLTGKYYFDFVGATVTQISGTINTTSATLPATPPENVSMMSFNLTTVSSDASLNTERRRVTITTPTTYYLVGQAAFSAGAINCYGTLLATRVN